MTTAASTITMSGVGHVGRSRDMITRMTSTVAATITVGALVRAALLMAYHSC